jgi:hypothetical protein
MEDGFILGEDLPLPPARLFERLAQVPGYTWDQSVSDINVQHFHLLTRNSVCALSLVIRPLVCRYRFPGHEDI